MVHHTFPHQGRWFLTPFRSSSSGHDRLCLSLGREHCRHFGKLTLERFDASGLLLQSRSLLPAVLLKFRDARGLPSVYPPIA
jgi:hypothetical protein